METNITDNGHLLTETEIQQAKYINELYKVMQEMRKDASKYRRIKEMLEHSKWNMFTWRLYLHSVRHIIRGY